MTAQVIHYLNSIKCLQATVPFARRFWDHPRTVRRSTANNMTERIIVRLVSTITYATFFSNQQTFILTIDNLLY